MKHFILERSDDEFYTSTSGIALVGHALNRFTKLTSSIAKAVPLAHGISHADVIRSFCALLSQGKSDYAAIEQHREDDFFREALGLSQVPSEATLRQRMDDHAAEFLRVVSWATVEFLMKAEVPLTALSTGHIAVDIDGFAMDNSGTKKECVSRTYRNFDGYLAMPVYLANEGWLIECPLLPGSQHPQKAFIPLLQRALAKIEQVCKEKKILVRTDSAHDAAANRVELSRHDGVDYIIKWNPRKQDPEAWKTLAFSEGRMETPRPGKRVASFSVTERHSATDENGQEQEFSFRRVVRVTERTIDKKGQQLLIPETELEGWWTSLSVTDEEVIALYQGHGLCEQYHSEIKTDMDLERFPSGKFATNQLVMACAALVYNILRFIGQLSLVTSRGIIRHPAKRRRIKTVIQELICRAARLIATGRRLKLRFSRHVQGHFEAYRIAYQRLAYG
jgi:hypothetical protein